MQETWIHFLSWEDPLEEGMATHSSILAWRLPWTEKPSGVTKSQTWLSNWAQHTMCIWMCEYNIYMFLFRFFFHYIITRYYVLVGYLIYSIGPQRVAEQLSTHMRTVWSVNPKLLVYPPSPLSPLITISCFLRLWVYICFMVVGGLVSKLCSTLVIPWTAAHQAPLSMDFPGKNAGVGCHFLPQGIFPTQKQNSCLPYCRRFLYHWATREAMSVLYKYVHL